LREKFGLPPIITSKGKKEEEDMKKIIFTTIVGISFLLLSGLVAGPPTYAQLKPPLPDLTGIVKDKNWALVLGKALFFDQQVGSDGQACYSCHFHAGADTRLKNQLSPGFTDITYGLDGDEAFGSIQSDTGQVPLGYMPSGALAGPNYTLKPKDFPGHQLVDETDKNSQIQTTTNDRISSQGSFDGTFGRVSRLRFRDWCEKPDGDIFHAGPYPARLVEPRHTPTTIMAAFNHRNFWDGRANNLFNGIGVFGMRDIYGDPKNRLIVLDASGKPQLGFLQLENASLASQAVGPPLSEREMSCDGRTFPDVGRKMLLRIPLALQNIHAQDSVFGKPGPFGDLRSRFGRGLNPKYLYAELIKKAFEDKYWKAPGRYEIADGGTLKKAPLTGFTQMEHNFSMFWGISIMLYEATLVSDQTEFDKLTGPEGGMVAAPVRGCFPAGPPGTPVPPGIDALWLRGCNIFFQAPFGAPRGAGCVLCHAGPVFTENANTETSVSTFTPFLNPVPDLKGTLDIRDFGWHNIGLRPVFSDLMVGGEDPYGYPLSYGRQYKQYKAGGDDRTKIVDPFLLKAIDTGKIQTGIVGGTVSKLAADGGTKVPTMRNIGLTPPYFSWGFYSNLRQVLKVYNRGMNPRDIAYSGHPDAHGSLCSSGDSSGSGPDGDSSWPVTVDDCNTNTNGLITPLGLLDCDAKGEVNPLCTAQGKDTTNDDLAALERFLKSLTDRRVQCDQAPFDHPSFFIFNGHRETDKNHDGLADDIIFELPAVGAAGYDTKSGYCIPNAGDLFAPGMQSRSGGLRVPLNE
jgi:cytochrome c peroxidase